VAVEPEVELELELEVEALRSAARKLVRLSCM